MARPKRPGAKPRSMWTTEEEYKELMDHLRDMRDGEELNDNEKLGLLVKHASSLTRNEQLNSRLDRIEQKLDRTEQKMDKILGYCEGED